MADPVVASVASQCGCRGPDGAGPCFECRTVRRDGKTAHCLREVIGCGPGASPFDGTLVRFVAPDREDDLGRGSWNVARVKTAVGLPRHALPKERSQVLLEVVAALVHEKEDPVDAVRALWEDFDLGWPMDTDGWPSSPGVYEAILRWRSYRTSYEANEWDTEVDVVATRPTTFQGDAA